MTNDSDWGEWQIHDGKGCPCVGQMVRAEYELEHKQWLGGGPVYESGTIAEFIAVGGPSWFWDNESNPIIRYRIRRPKGMAILNAILADLPAPTQPMKTDGVIA